MIEVTARYFAAFREQAGCEQERLSTACRTAAELFDEVAARHAFRDAAARCKVAINGSLSDWGTELADSDEVLFFPPVAGG
jgi:molybdopterin converting factor small subunit